MAPSHPRMGIRRSREHARFPERIDGPSLGRRNAGGVDEEAIGADLGNDGLGNAHDLHQGGRPEVSHELVGERAPEGVAVGEVPVKASPTNSLVKAIWATERGDLFRIRLHWTQIVRWQNRGAESS